MPDALPKIAPCPFCGGQNSFVYITPENSFRVLCRSTGCDAGGPGRERETDAIDAWNATVSRAGPDSFEHWTCGTAHIRAKRTLQIVESVRAFDNEAIETIAALVDEAGVGAAREALMDEVPF